MHPFSPTLQVLDISTRYWQSQCLFVVAMLGVADVVQDAPLDVPTIAAKVGAQAPLLKRVLRALASMDVFAEDEQGRYGLTPLADVLRSDHPQSARSYVMMVGDDYNWDAWKHLLHGVKTGELPFDHALKQPYFDYLAKHPDKEQVFADSMSSFATTNVAAIASAYPFNEVKSVVDVGGSNGHLLAKILEKHPHLSGLLFDLPGVVAAAQTQGYINAPEVAARIKVQVGDMFVAVPEGFDAYVLKSVLHDWDDEDSVRILQNCTKAMAPNGRVLVVEGIVKPANQPDPMKFMDLAMFASSGGQERTEQEFRELLKQAGLKVTRIVPTQSNRLVIEAVRGNY